MKKLLTFIFVLILSSCSSPREVGVEKLQDRNGLLYEINSQEPFTGISLEFWSNGQIKERKTLKDGTINFDDKDFFWESFYENGQLESRFLQNFSEGYYPNGQLKSLEENNILTGYSVTGEKDYAYFPLYEGKVKKLDGLSIFYTTDGEISYKTCYKDNLETDLSYCEK